MADVWIVVIQDRRLRYPDVLPFSTENAACATAWDTARLNAPGPGDVNWEAEPTPDMTRAGCVMWLPYGTEGDCVRVVRREMDKTED